MGVAHRSRPRAGSGAVIDVRGTRATSRSPAVAWLVVLGAGAAVSGARAFLLHAQRVGPSSDALAVVYWSTLGVTGVAVLLLIGELLALVGGPAAGPRAAVHRLPAWLCLVAVAVLGVVAHGHGAGGDEPALTLVLAVQLLMTATAVLPAVVRDAR